MGADAGGRSSPRPQVKRQAPVIGSTFNLLDAAARGKDAFIGTVSELLSARNDPGRMVPGAVYLPDARFVRDLGISSAAAGGNLSRPALMQVAQAARPQLLLERLGAERVVVTQSLDLSLPVWVAGDAAGWVAENSPAPVNTSAIRTVTMTGKVACSRLAITRKMFLGWTDVQASALQELGNSIATTIESGFITGTGAANQPLGLLNTPGRSTVTFAASSPTYAELRQMLSSYIVADGDLESAAWILHPQDFAALASAPVSATAGSDTMLQFQDGQWRILGIPAYPTRNTTQGRYLLLAPSEVVTAYWGSPQLVADSYSGGKSISGATDLVVFNITDVGAKHPARIVVGSN